MSIADFHLSARLLVRLGILIPGLALSTLVAGAAWQLGVLIPDGVPLPAMVIALVIGIALNPFAGAGLSLPGIAFGYKTLLRTAVALMGLRVSLGDIAALGVQSALLIVFAMTATIVLTFMLARALGKSPEFGALVGVATAVCGASAALATSAVLRDYPGKQTETAFVIVAVNALATIALLAYPPLCLMLGFDQQTSGVMLGGTIHDVAQVAGAGYGMADAAGNSAVVVKLFRVLLLLPVVFAIGLYFQQSSSQEGPAARVSVPLFAIVFLLLCILNSGIQGFPTFVPAFESAKGVLVALSNAGLLIAISALGLSTSLRRILSLGWGHMGIVLASAFVLLAIVTGGLLLL